ncbi:MAG: tRNA-modifying protein YgfZ, partial [Deltaproteobacteria bacterium]|nr:tRNA-modifying protein YgfZ [Deltaproteobacteria bacterium]
LFPLGYGQKVKAHLDLYLNFSQSTWKDLSPQKILIGLNPNWPSLENQPEHYQLKHPLGWQYLVPEQNLQAFIKKNQAKEISSQEWESLRISLIYPKQGQDFNEENFPAETGLDKSHVSFNKGCYLGQETTARIESQGRVQQKIYLLKLNQAPEKNLPLEVFQGEKKLGTLSSIGLSKEANLGLAMLKTRELQKNLNLQIKANTVIEAQIRQN